jgi:hypothetical protein
LEVVLAARADLCRIDSMGFFLRRFALPSFCHPERSEGPDFFEAKEKADPSGKPRPRDDNV